MTITWRLRFLIRWMEFKDHSIQTAKFWWAMKVALQGGLNKGPQVCVKSLKFSAKIPNFKKILKNTPIVHFWNFLTNYFATKWFSYNNFRTLIKNFTYVIKISLTKDSSPTENKNVLNAFLNVFKRVKNAFFMITDIFEKKS